MDVRRKVELLINLAVSADHTNDKSLTKYNANEKASAALLACKLIKENGLLDAKPRRHTESRPIKTPPPPREKRTTARTMKSRYDGLCRNCGKPYKAGDAIAWRHGIGAVIVDHKICVAWLEKQEISHG